MSDNVKVRLVFVVEMSRDIYDHMLSGSDRGTETYNTLMATASAQLWDKTHEIEHVHSAGLELLDTKDPAVYATHYQHGLFKIIDTEVP